MSPSTFAILVVVLVTTVWLFVHRRRPSNGRKNLPPGPPALPLIGNLHMLGALPHRALHNLSKKYGPIMSLRLGSILTIVVSSPEAAELVLKTHDTVFASRPNNQSSKYLSYGRKGLVYSDYGPYWRNVRKMCTLELLTTVKIDSFAEMRMSEVKRLVESLKGVPPGTAVDLSERGQLLIADMSYTMFFGRRSDESVDLRDTMHQIFEVVGAFNVSDYIPLLKPFDVQGLRRRMRTLFKRLDKILESILDEDEHEASGEQNPRKDFVHVLLSLMNSSSNAHNKEVVYSIDRENIKSILKDLIAASLDSSSMVTDWVMTELMRNPRVMEKVREEIKNVVGEGRMVEEKDLSKFEYLDMVIKESLRLHPPAPLLIPRESSEDIVIGGYYIPKKSRIFVNYWTISRDPNVWSENVDEFLPERFASTEIDYRGRHFQFIPFGSGRRGCPGIHLGMTNVRLAVSQLVHCFDWELPNGMLPTELDMTEKFGLSLPRAKHLHVIPTYRLH